MAKIFYIAMVDSDTTQAFFFNNKKKAQEKGMELYDGFGDFSFDLDGEEFEGDYATSWIYSCIKNVKDVIIIQLTIPCINGEAYIYVIKLLRILRSLKYVWVFKVNNMFANLHSFNKNKTKLL